MSETMRDLIEHGLSDEERAEKIAALLDAVSDAKNLSEVGDCLDADPIARQIIGDRLEVYKIAFHNRVADLYERKVVGKKEAECLLLLTGAHDYDTRYKVKLGQYMGVAELRSDLRERYAIEVPEGNQSAVFSGLVEAKLPNGSRPFVPDYGTFVENTAIAIPLNRVGSRKRHRLLDNQAAMEFAAGDPAVRSLILEEAGRMLEFLYPSQPND